MNIKLCKLSQQKFSNKLNPRIFKSIKRTNKEYDIHNIIKIIPNPILTLHLNKLRERIKATRQITKPITVGTTSLLYTFV